MTVPNAATVATRPATASELLFLTGIEEVPPDALPDGPARQLAAEFRSKRLPLAAHTVAAALWNLQLAGAISLEPRKTKSLGLISRTELVATMRQPSAAWYGFEGQLLSTLARKPERDVNGLIGDWFGKKVSDVDAAIRQRALAGLAEAGLISWSQADAGRGRITGRVLGNTRTVLEPNHAAIRAAADQVSGVAAAWQAFPQTSPALASDLVERSRKALDAREFSSDSGGGGHDF